MRRMAIPLLILLSTCCAPAQAGNDIPTDTSFSYESDPGSFGGGLSGKFTDADSKFRIVAGGTRFFALNVKPQVGATWTIEMQAPAGEGLHTGTFPLAERAGFQTGRSPGLEVYYTGGCNQVWGSYTIEQIRFDDTKTIKLLDASFSIRCAESELSPGVRGVVHYKAPPLTFGFTSEPGERLGGGRSVSYSSSTSVFRLTGKNSGVQYTVSGKRDQWLAFITPPIGQVLQPGNYAIAKSHTPTEAGLDFMGNGQACITAAGSLTITSVTFDADLQVKSLAATFEYHCDGQAQAFRGTIRHNNL